LWSVGRRTRGKHLDDWTERPIEAYERPIEAYEGYAVTESLEFGALNGVLKPNSDQTG